MNVAEVIPIARSAARSIHARRTWLDLDDLEQEAVRAVLEAAKKYDPTRGDWGPYARWKAEAHLRRYAMDVSAPVTSKHDRRKLFDVRRAKLPETSEPARAEDAVRDREVRRRLAELLGPERAELAFRVFAGGERPREVAKRTKTTARSVTAKLSAIRAAVRADPLLREIAL